MTQGAIYNEVQAALINSECSPGCAVERAPHAVIRFAREELDATEEQFGELSAALWKRTKTRRGRMSSCRCRRGLDEGLGERAEGTVRFLYYRLRRVRLHPTLALVSVVDDTRKPVGRELEVTWLGFCACLMWPAKASKRAWFWP